MIDDDLNIVHILCQKFSKKYILNTVLHLSHASHMEVDGDARDPKYSHQSLHNTLWLRWKDCGF